MHDFFRFPHTPHLTWMGKGAPRDDKILSSAEVDFLLADDVLVEEKLDGANLGLSFNVDGVIKAQNRGQYLLGLESGQFSRLPAWIDVHEDALSSLLTPNLILFGEWCAARHSLSYDALPDWFLLFDVYDRDVNRFWSSMRRNALANKLGLVTVPKIFQGHLSLSDLQELLEGRNSFFGGCALEGVVVRKESLDWCEARAKLVCPDFTQNIDDHWRKRKIEWNKVKY